MKTLTRHTFALLPLFLLGAGCASTKPVLERGWIGGQFASARPAKACFFHRDIARVIAGFPKELQPEYQGGVLVTAVTAGTPLWQAGARPGDLILAANGRPVFKVAVLRRTIESAAPGTRLKLKVWRDHKLRDVATVIGRERFKQWHYFQIGLGLSTAFDFQLWPGDSFSLVVLGYHRDHHHLELHGPVSA